MNIKIGDELKVRARVYATDPGKGHIQVGIVDGEDEYNKCWISQEAIFGKDNSKHLALLKKKREDLDAAIANLEKEEV